MSIFCTGTKITKLEKEKKIFENKAPSIVKNNEAIHFGQGNLIRWSRLFYNTSARAQQHQCDTSGTSLTRVRHEPHECDKSATRVKNFDFGNGMSENNFHTPIVSYMTNERLPAEFTFEKLRYAGQLLLKLRAVKRATSFH